MAKDHLIGTDDKTPDVESELDMSVIWWASANATLWYESYDGWMLDWTVDFMTRKDFPKVVSLSYAWSETEQCQEITNCPNGETNKQYIDRTNKEFLKMVARGTTIVVAAGDAGSPGRTDEACTHNRINPVFPGSSEWVLTVGASYVDDLNPVKKHWTSPDCYAWISGCSNGTSEQMNTFNETDWTSGSGCSWFTSTPTWQQKQVIKYLNSGVLLTKNSFYYSVGRAYPDITTVGHYCSVYNSRARGWTVMDGTSCSSPVMAGIIAYLNNFQKSRGRPELGFANPLLYKMYEHNSSLFNDIFVGNSSCTEIKCCDHNHGFRPVEGMWDLVSGSGSPNVGNMMKWLSQHT